MLKWISTVLLVVVGLIVVPEAHAKACRTDADCSNAVFCDGEEICDKPKGAIGTCVDGPDPCSEPGAVCLEDADGCAVCTRDIDCNDGVFCNGEERCTPGASDANGRGCAPSITGHACAAGQVCNEANDVCLNRCEAEGTADGDGDGVDAMECGGSDCDDRDANRFPGNKELCDANHDEDCDPTTVGNRDDDSDLFVDFTCCNEVPGFTKQCGDDCDDSNPAIHPGAMVCSTNPSEIRICKSRQLGGDYRSERCFDDRVCNPLENGTGMCMRPQPAPTPRVCPTGHKSCESHADCSPEQSEFCFEGCCDQLI